RRLEAGDEPGQLVGAGLPQGGGGPQGVAPGQAEAAEGAGGGQALDGVGRGAGAAGEVLQVLERAVGPFGPDALQQRVAEVTYVKEDDPHRPRRVVGVPAAGDGDAPSAAGAGLG